MVNLLVRLNSLIFITYFIFISSIDVYAQKKWTLEECVKRGIEKNITIANSKVDLQYSHEEKLNAIGNFIPTINLNGNHIWNMGLTQDVTTGILEDQTTQYSTIGANVNFNIYNNLQNIKIFHKANLLKLSKKYQLENIKENVALLIINSYLQILFNKETLTIQNSQLEIANEELKIAKEKFNTGIIPKGELYEIEAILAKAEQNLVIAQNNYMIAKIQLAQLILIDNLEKFEIADEKYEIPITTILEKTAKEIYLSSLNMKSEIKIAETNLKIAEKEKSIAYASIYPTITGYYSYNSSLLKDSPESYKDQFELNAGENIGIQISIPILNNFYKATLFKKSKLNVLKGKNNLYQARLDLENTINQALSDAKGALKTYEATNKTLKARKIAYNYAKDSFENGALNTFNFLQAKKSYEDAQSKIVKTKYDYIFKLKILEFYYGVPNLYL